MTSIDSIGAVGNGRGNPFRSEPTATEAAAQTKAPGKSAHSTAAQARRILALQTGDETGARQPFGQTVSQVARGLLSVADVVALQAETEAATDETTEATGDAAPATDDATPIIDGAAVVPDADNALVDALNELLTDAPGEATVG